MNLISRVFNWAKRNKLAAFLIIVVLYFLFGSVIRSLFSVNLTSGTLSVPGAFESRSQLSAPLQSIGGIGGGGSYYPNYNPVAPAPEVKDRMVVQESYLSLLVKNVAQALNAIKEKTTALGGYMVASSLSNPQEAASGNITLRVPQDKFDEALNSFRSLSLKVVSENLQGTDVTDQYVDIEARLAPLLKNKTRFEELMNRAEKIEDILRIQQEIISLQNQIDSLKGQQNYLKQTAAMSKITIYLSTDEFALPYTPSQPWRPEVIFKQAVRSLIGNLRSLGTLVIWVVVYTVIWLPIVLIVLLIRSRRRKISPPPTPTKSSF